MLKTLNFLTRDKWGCLYTPQLYEVIAKIKFIISNCTVYKYYIGANYKLVPLMYLNILQKWNVELNYMFVNQNANINIEF